MVPDDTSDREQGADNTHSHGNLPTQPLWDEWQRRATEGEQRNGYGHDGHDDATTGLRDWFRRPNGFAG